MPSLTPFKTFPVELYLEILDHATSVSERGLEESYINASTFARVSNIMRPLAMKRLLHTVILSSEKQAELFLQTLAFQQGFTEQTEQESATSEPRQSAKLSLDYSTLIHHFWCSDKYQLLIPNYNESEAITYRRLLHGILRNTRTVGLGFGSMYLLTEALKLEKPDPKGSTSYRSSITLASGQHRRCGPHFLNNPDPKFQEFLQNITHLAIWGSLSGRPYHHHPLATERSVDYQLPGWFKNIPFQCMRALTEFACTLVFSKCSETVPIAVYRPPTTSELSSETSSTENQPTKTRVQQWANSEDPLSDPNVVFIHKSGFQPSELEKGDLPMVLKAAC